MIEQLIKQLQDIDESSDQQQYKEEICRAVASFCLTRFIKATEVKAELIKQIVLVAKGYNPDFSVLRLSVYTGVDRRIIRKVIDNEKLYDRLPKEDMVLNYLQAYCKKYNTTKIIKHGQFDSFDYFCKLAAYGALTPPVIAAELISQGKIIDNPGYFQLAPAYLN